MNCNRLTWASTLAKIKYQGLDLLSCLEQPKAKQKTKSGHQATKDKNLWKVGNTCVVNEVRPQVAAYSNFSDRSPERETPSTAELNWKRELCWREVGAVGPRRPRWLEVQADAQRSKLHRGRTTGIFRGFFSSLELSTHQCVSVKEPPTLGKESPRDQDYSGWYSHSTRNSAWSLQPALLSRLENPTSDSAFHKVFKRFYLTSGEK